MPAALPLLPAELLEELEFACMDSLQGRPAGPSLYATLRRVVEARLAPHFGRRMKSWRVHVGPGSEVGLVEVRIDIQRDRRVESVQIHVGAG